VLSRSLTVTGVQNDASMVQHNGQNFFKTTSQYFNSTVDICSPLLTNTDQYFVRPRVILGKYNITIVIRSFFIKNAWLLDGLGFFLVGLQKRQPTSGSAQ
jgi:hypothetical protein